MITASNALKAYLPTAVEPIPAELYTLTLVNGQVLRWCAADKDVVLGGHTFSSKGSINTPTIQRGDLSSRLSVEVDELEITLGYASQGNVYGGVTLAQAIARGDLAQANLLLQWLFMPTWNDTSLGAITKFSGRVADIEGVSRTQAKLKIRSMMELLNVNWPRMLITPGCQWTLFDAGCLLNPASFVTAGVVSNPSTRGTVNASGLSGIAGYYDQGTIVFTSGANAGVRRFVKSYVPGTPEVVSLAFPLLYAPTVGDLFNIYAGCDKTQATCFSKFNNLTHFNGQPYVPVPETGI